MLRLVMPLNIVYFAYCDGFKADKAMWYVVDFSEKVIQPSFVVKHTLFLVHHASFRIHGVESQKIRCVKQSTNVEAAYKCVTQL